jgi:hypothetical protein
LDFQHFNPAFPDKFVDLPLHLAFKHRLKNFDFHNRITFSHQLATDAAVTEASAHLIDSNPIPLAHSGNSAGSICRRYFAGVPSGKASQAGFHPSTKLG